MKTKTQVLAHLAKVGYSKEAIMKIMGFLIGNGTKTIDEEVVYLIGNGDFSDFMNWYQSDDDAEQECLICKAFDKLFDAMKVADENEDEEMTQKLDDLLDIMLTIFVEEADGNNE